ncbi:MAG TPA: LCP family protein [Candidatus Limnocylindrales bacterium]|nr:LCP family protein [Candidatus Limnocylindrales bacterium]
MHAPEGPRPRARSPFVAAVLSLFFPGLGHAYAGAYQRALGFAALPILLIALLAGVVLRAEPGELIGLLLTPWVLPSVFVMNLAVLLYRLVAIIDAYRVTVFMNAVTVSGGGRLGRPKLVFNPLSIAGLFAVLLVMSGSHAVVARYDLIALNALNDQCVFVGNSTTDIECPGAAPSPTGSADPSAVPGESGSPTPTLTEPPVQGSALPNVTIPPWDGQERLNILLIGSDQRPKEGTYNTDTLIVVSIDPVTKQVAMFSLPRDTVDVPLPAGPLRNAYGRVYERKINALFTSVRNRPDLVPGTDVTRGYNGLKMVLGNLYGLDIKYFVEVNFDGFKQVVDALGGVTINVQIPVIDEAYPSDTGRLARVYIPAGLQHMTGAEALVYARSRHSGQGDFDRAARQQRVLTSLREQADIANLIPRIPQLVEALKKTVRTDIPQEELAKLAGLAGSVDTRNIRSYVFTPPRYATEYLHSDRGYIIVANAERIREAVANAFSIDPQLEDQRDAFAQEGGTIWVLNGSGKEGQASDVAGYLGYYGLTASAPVQKPDLKPAATTIVVYNGRETALSETIKYLEETFAVKVTTKSDPTARVDIVITTADSTPNLVAPSGP